jgi:hypothetical protein
MLSPRQCVTNRRSAAGYFGAHASRSLSGETFRRKARLGAAPSSATHFTRACCRIRAAELLPRTSFADFDAWPGKFCACVTFRPHRGTHRRTPQSQPSLVCGRAWGPWKQGRLLSHLVGADLQRRPSFSLLSGFAPGTARAFQSETFARRKIGAPSKAGYIFAGHGQYQMRG